jgi:hypothetical protein
VDSTFGRYSQPSPALQPSAPHMPLEHIPLEHMPPTHAPLAQPCGRAQKIGDRQGQQRQSFWHRWGPQPAR